MTVQLAIGVTVDIYEGRQEHGKGKSESGGL